jgi:O-antigen/teichoic acid export membrane protein
MGIKKRIVSNTVYNVLDWISIAVVGYIFWAFMGKTLPPDAYGILLTVLILYNFSVNLLSFNVQDVLGKFIPHYLAVKKAEQVFSTTTFMFAISLALIGAFSILVYSFAGELAASVYSNPAMGEGFRLLAILTFFGYFYMVFKAVLYGFRDFKGMFLSDLIGGTVRLAFSIIFVYGGYLLGGAYGWVAGFFCAAVIAFLCARSHGFRFKSVGGADKKEIIRYGSASVLVFTAHNILVQLGALLLGFLSSMHSVGLFGVAVLFGNFAVLPLAMVQGTLFPTFSELLSKNDLYKLSELLNRALKYIFAFSVPLLAIICLFPTTLIQIVYTSNYLEAWPAVVLYAPSMFILSTTSILLSVIFLSNRPYMRFKITAVAVAIDLVLSVMLIKSLDFVGVALAFLLTAFATFIFVHNYVQKSVGIRISIDFKRLLLPLPMFFVLYVAVNMFPVGIMLIFPAFAGVYLLYLYLLLKTRFFNIEDAKMLDYLPGAKILDPLIRGIKNVITKQTVDSAFKD